MKSFEERLYEKQAQMITDLRQENATLKTRLEKSEASHNFYMGLVNAIKDDIFLQSEWVRFIGMLRLAKPNLPGLTCAEELKKIQ